MSPDTQERCECCDNLPGQCGSAAQAAQRASLELWRRWLCRHGWFRSNYPGACNQCGTAFKPGAAIRSDGFTGRGGVYAAECCAPDLPGSN